MMDYRINILIAILLGYLVRLPKIDKDIRFLVFALNVIFSGTLTKGIFALNIPAEKCGQFGTYFELDGAIFLGVIILVLYPRIRTISYNVKMWLIVILAIILNVFSKDNIFRATSLVPIFRISQLFFFVFIVRPRFTQQQLLMAIYETFVCILFVQVFLTICYPVLGMSKVLTLFNDAAEHWSERRDSYSSAVGTFGHPGGLGYYSSLMCVLFFSSYLLNYKKQLSLICCILSVFTLFFTYSRTSYLALFGSVFSIYLLYLKPRLSIRYLYYLLVIALLVRLLLLIPVISDLFTKSDSDEMMNARLIHWVMGYEAFIINPVFGCGINAHLILLPELFGGMVESFYIENPIHNVHIIILVEMGVVGFLVWLMLLFRYCICCYRINALYTDACSRIRHLSIIGMLLFVMIYGMAGWSMFNRLIYPTIIIVIALLFDEELCHLNPQKLNDNKQE